jgi:hypothetical protein
MQQGEVTMDWDDIYMEVHEQLIEEYLEAHPGAGEDEAYWATQAVLGDAVADRWSELVDHAHDLMSE